MNHRTKRDCNNVIESEILHNIESDGWSLMSVLASPPFVYTIGLEHSFEHPELIVLGMPPDFAGSLLNKLGQQIASGRHFHPGDICRGEEVGCSANLQFGEVSSKARKGYMLSANWFYFGGDFRGLQLIWPDTKHRFPGEPGFEQRFYARQPILAPPDPRRKADPRS
jgi:hypothetical protein